VRTDTKDEPHLPGSTVAGALRAYCATQNDLNASPELFGPIPSSSDKARGASPIQVLGTVYRTAGTPTKQRRRTAIDGKRGAAANTKLYAVEQLPANTAFDVFLRWDDPDDRYELFLERLESWQPRLGRGVSQGAGQCTVTELGSRVFDLSTPDGLLDWLRISSLDGYPERRPVRRGVETEPLRDIEFEIVDALHMGTGEFRETKEGLKISTIVRDGGDSDGVPVVPGSGLKGILRSRAEYICRVVGAPACDDQCCGTCRPCKLFGFTGEELAAQRAKIVVHDAVIEEPVTQERQHVALDRFTGGAAPGLLYTDEVIASGRFRLRIDALDPGKIDDTDLLLLDAVVADLNDGLIGLGARTTAGYGTVRIISDTRESSARLTELSARLSSEAL
jgi:CRISPR/Cas system CSM-associated protein Csm3 (group 7 of RAMP superfamily)